MTAQEQLDHMETELKCMQESMLSSEELQGVVERMLEREISTQKAMRDLLYPSLNELGGTSGKVGL